MERGTRRFGSAPRLAVALSAAVLAAGGGDDRHQATHCRSEPGWGVDPDAAARRAET